LLIISLDGLRDLFGQFFCDEDDPYAFFRAGIELVAGPVGILRGYRPPDPML